MLNKIDAELLRCATELRLMVRAAMSDEGAYMSQFDMKCGICSNLDNLRDPKIVQYGFMGKLTDIAEQWPHYSGNSAYPVQSTDEGINAHHKYHDVDGYDRWLQGDYAELRRDLLDFIIKTLEDKNVEI